MATFAPPPPIPDTDTAGGNGFTPPPPVPDDSTAGTPEDGFLTKLKRSLGIEHYEEPLPQVPGEENVTQPEWAKAPEGALRKLASAMVPHDLKSYAAGVFSPLAAFEQGKQLAQGDVSSVPLVGRVPEIMQAEQTSGLSEERYLTAMKTLMDFGLLAGAGGERAPSPLRTEPLVPEPPPTVPSLRGPTTIAQDVSRALERRFTLQPTPPEAPPEIAPGPPIEETLPNIREPLPFNPEAGPAPQPEFPMPVRTEFGRLPGAPEPQLSPTERNGQILARRQGILDRKAELTARASNGEQGLETHLAAVDADLMDPANPVVHAPPPKSPLVTPELPATETKFNPETLQHEPKTDRDFWFDGLELRQSVVNGLARLGVDVGKTDLPSPEHFTSGKDFFYSMREAEAKMRQSGAKAAGFVFQDRGYTPPEAPVQAPGGAGIALEAPGGVPGAEIPPDYTPEAAAARTAQPEETGISKAAIAGQREARELPAIERQKQIDFGESLDRAKATLAQDPMAGQRLVEELTAKPRAVNPEDTPLLIERMQQAQREFDAANKAVNEAAPEQLEVAKARLEHARTEYDKTVTATQNATSTTGAGLNSVKMILNEDYSLARMESRKRAANNGSISEEQKIHTDELHAKIAELSDRMDKLDRQRSGFKVGDVGKEAAAARKSGKRLTDYTGEAAQRARERINRQLHGLGAKPAPPTLLYDYAVVGADHLARGLTKFSDWSAQMIKEFGEKVKPHLQDLWKMARAVHDSTAKAFRTPEEARLERYKTGLAKQTVGVTAKIQRGDFTKPTRQQLVLDKAAYKMKGNLQRLKNEFERGVAKDAYNNMSPADKFWQHFVGVERAMKLSSPGVFEKLGIAAAVREVLAPAEAAGGYAAATFFPRLAKGTRYGADLRTIVRAEIKAKAALFTEGMKDAAENLKGKETGLEAMSDKYGRRPDFWYNRIGKIHAAVKAPVKRAEFVRSLEHRMDAAVKAGEDINHPEVMDRLATESALDANRAIFQQNTVVSKFFSQLDRLHPAGGRAARFLQPVVRIPVNLFKEFVTYHVGAPAAVLKIGHAYWKGVETLPPVAREAIIRQLVKGSVGGAGILWGYYNREKVHDFFASVPPGFEHTPIAMAIHEGSIIKGLEEQGTGTKYKPTEAFKDVTKMAKYDIPFAYTLTGLADALDPSDPNGWRKYLYSMIQGTVVPQAVSWTAKELDKPTPFSIFDKPVFRPPTNITEAITQGIPGLRQDIPEYHSKKRGGH